MHLSFDILYEKEICSVQRREDVDQIVSHYSEVEIFPYDCRDQVSWKMRSCDMQQFWSDRNRASWQLLINMLHMCNIHRPYLIYLEAVYLQKLVSILRHLRDVNVQLKVPHRKGAEVLNLYAGKE